MMGLKKILGTGLVLSSMMFMACDDSSSASGGFSCDVTRKSGTVKVTSTVPGIGSMSVTISESQNADFQNYRVIKSEYSYNDASMAKNQCGFWKEEADEWRDGSVSAKCSGNTVYVTEYDKGSLDEHEREYKEMCEEEREMYESGEMDY